MVSNSLSSLTESEVKPMTFSDGMSEVKRIPLGEICDSGNMAETKAGKPPEKDENESDIGKVLKQINFEKMDGCTINFNFIQ